MNKDNVILCRCEDISLKQVQDYINQGYTTFEDLKRLLRVGMGPCQASTCGHLIQKEISRMLNLPIEDVAIHKVRPLILGVPLHAIAGETDEER